MQYARAGRVGSDAASASTLCQPYATIDEVFGAVRRGEIDRGVVPFENMIHGPVTETFDSLFQHASHVHIVDMWMLAIEHCLGAVAGEHEVRRVLSKDQALHQCSTFLHTHFPSAEWVETASTSAAVREVAREGNHDAAAVASRFAIEQAGLKVIAQGIGNTPNNKTRFAVLSGTREVASAPGGLGPSPTPHATAIAIYPRYNRLGFLEDIVQILSSRYHVNLCSIHSRPDALGAFRFYLELEGSEQEPPIVESLAALRKQFEGEDVQVVSFGSYPRFPFVERSIRSVGIVGGTGAMGQWFKRYFEELGLKVYISGRATPMTYEACVELADVVLVNVPIAHTEEMIRRLGPQCRPGQLLVDNTSIKAGPVAAMLASSHPDVEVLGMHTVFGPAIAHVRHQNVIFTRTERSKERAVEFENLFYSKGARITRTTPEHHDQQMAFHQNLEHFVKVSLAEVLRNYVQSPSELEQFSSPNSRLTLASMGRILSGDPTLYAEIQHHNPQSAALISTFVQVVNRLAQSLLQGNAEPFAQSMQHSVQALGPEYIAELKRQSLRYDRGRTERHDDATDVRFKRHPGDDT